jgi:hypothetical protein
MLGTASRPSGGLEAVGVGDPMPGRAGMSLGLASLSA